MTGRGKDAVIAGLAIATSTMLLMTGCGRLRVGFTDGQKDHPLESGSREGTLDPGAEPTGRDAVLAAVEEFLQRTEEYGLAEGTRSTPTPEPAPGVPTPPKGKDADAAHRQAVASVDPVNNEGPSRPEAYANTQVALTDDVAVEKELALPVVQSVSIRSPIPLVSPAGKQPPARTTNEPLDTQASSGSISVDRFLQHLKSRAEEAADFDTEWQLRLAQLALNHDVEAFEASSELSPDGRCILSAVIQAVDAARRAARNPLAAGEDAVSRAEELVHALADRADPIVPTVALCRKVVTFGSYDEMTEEEFVAGRTTQTILYCEVRNFRSEKTSDGLHRTVLGTRLEILTSDGQSVWQHEEPEIIDLCRRRRTDFFIAQRITLPPTLSPNDYVLKVLVEDKLSGKANEATHPFRIGLPTSIAASR